MERSVARPRRGYLFAVDIKVLNAGWQRHRAGHARFYGLEIALNEHDAGGGGHPTPTV
jgi:hypothetical protein